MLKKFAVALVAASLIAGPAFAQGTTNTAPVTTGQPAKADAKVTVKKHIAHKHVAKKHVATAKHHAKKVHVTKVKHGKAIKRVKKPAQNTVG